MIDQNLIQLIRQQFVLEWDGIHGAPHWARVRENGLRLAEVTGAKRNVIKLFAFLHDSRRRHDGADPQHRQRAAAFATELAGTAFQLEPDELELLTTACSKHSDGLINGDIAVLTCWDVDRLDLGRVGNRPRPDLLCTDCQSASKIDPGAALGILDAAIRVDVDELAERVAALETAAKMMRDHGAQIARSGA